MWGFPWFDLILVIVVKIGMLYLYIHYRRRLRKWVEEKESEKR